MPLWGAIDELAVHNGLLLKEDRVCIPAKLYLRMLHEIYDGHKGVEKMQHLARDRIYWQGMGADIAEYVKHCKVYTKHKATQAIEPMLPKDIPEGPWQDLATDFFHHNKAEYLLIADSFNKYPFLYKISSKTYDSIVKKI